MFVLVLNAGSSTLKFSIFDSDKKCTVISGNVDKIGSAGKIKVIYSDKKYLSECSTQDHTQALKLFLSAIEKEFGFEADKIDCIGHRIVHGGIKLNDAVMVDDKVIEEIARYSDYAPLHTPSQIATINACRAIFHEIPQVVVFDTGFHKTIPQKAFMMGLPYEYYEKYGIRYYGFHGISYSYLSKKAKEILSHNSLKYDRLVICHIGNGSSVAAIKNGQSVDVSTGFGTSHGMMMGTRSGSIDYAALEYIAKKEKLSFEDLNKIVMQKSGLLGISGISSDDRDIEEHMAKGNARARLAKEMQSYMLKKLIGSYTFAMGGLDAVVFSGGIGENSPILRAGCLSELEGLGICVDKEKNNGIIRGKTGFINSTDSSVKILVIPTEEEMEIADETLQVISKNTNS